MQIFELKRFAFKYISIPIFKFSHSRIIYIFNIEHFPSSFRRLQFNLNNSLISNCFHADISFVYYKEKLVVRVVIWTVTSYHYNTLKIVN